MFRPDPTPRSSQDSGVRRHALRPARLMAAVAYAEDHDVLIVAAAGNSGDGTSFAAPYVSGLAALVRSKFPELTAQEVKRRIEATADIPSGHLPHPKMGYGTINPERALTEVLASESAPATATPPPAVAMAPLPVPGHRDTGVRDRSVALAVSMIGLALLGAGATMAVRRTRVRR